MSIVKMESDMEDWEGLESNCCCAPIISHDICSDCKEHCEPIDRLGEEDGGPCKGQRAGSTDMDQLGEHEERIICPQCESEQLATVIHTWPWYSYVHECTCGYIIMESEWERVEPQSGVSTDISDFPVDL
jgi:hypothetical protein